MSAMWKPNDNPATSNPPSQDPGRQFAPLPALDPGARTTATGSEQGTIGKGLSMNGEITGSESLFIDGKVEGGINLPGSRVTIGRNGQVVANINAREIIIMGKVRGNVTASDRVDIRSEGALTGDATAARVSIEDGAFFKGGIDIRRSEAKAASTETSAQ